MTSSTPDPVPGTVASYDQGAAEYAEHSRDRAPLHHLHTRLRELLYPHALVLDLGCGPGHDAGELAYQGLTVVGLDAASGLLKLARAEASIAGRLVQGDARVLPFAAESFDGIWACASLLHIPKSQIVGALTEALRVLKPRGVLFTSMQHGSGEMVACDPGFGFGLRHYFFYEAPEWQALLNGAGFEIIDQRVNPTTYGLTKGANGWIETFARKP